MSCFILRPNVCVVPPPRQRRGDPKVHTFGRSEPTRCWTADERALSLRRNTMNLNERVPCEVMNCNDLHRALQRDDERRCAGNEGT